MLPHIITPPPGAQSRAMLERLAHAEAPSLTLPHGIVWAEAEGATITDVDGNRYLDLTSAFGVAGVGHRNPRVVAAVHDQANLLLHGMGDVYAHESRVALVEAIAHAAPIPDARVYLAGGGAEAVEIALKTAVLATGKSGIVAFTGGYHGLTLGALAPTSRAAFRDPFLNLISPNVIRAPYPYSYRQGDDCLEMSLDETERLIKTAAFPIGALIVEPIQGREGEIVPPTGWLSAIRAMCDKHGILLIADEIFTGWGRTGRWWGVEHDSVVPDLICMGKGMTGGVQIAACVGRADLMEHWRVQGEPLHTATFMGHPLGCAGALAAIKELQERNLVERCAELGNYTLNRLRTFAHDVPHIGDVRGRGLMIGIELVTDRISKTPDPERALATVYACLKHGVVILNGGMNGNVISITPPFIISQEQLDYALDVLENVVR